MTILCINCSSKNTSVVDTRKKIVSDVSSVLRRRMCNRCEARWNTVEVAVGTVKLPAVKNRIKPRIQYKTKTVRDKAILSIPNSVISALDSAGLIDWKKGGKPYFYGVEVRSQKDIS